jgi:DNA adenine methylase
MNPVQIGDAIPSRPVMRWHGGKWLLAPWIIEHLPPHRIYVEPFGGAASVLMRKPRAYSEVYNDLDDDVVNLFEVLRSDRAAELANAIKLTPFARTEFQAAYDVAADPLERARQLIVRSFQGFGSNGHNPAHKTGFRANSNRSRTTPARDWRNYPDQMGAIIDRLRGVTVEHRDALECMQAHDGPGTLHYVDPPYVPNTRDAGGDYVHELNDSDHDTLLEGICALSGMVVLSGYPAPKYDDALPDWHRIDRKALADGARERTEVLWINPDAWAALDKPPELFNRALADTEKPE